MTYDYENFDANLEEVAQAAGDAALRMRGYVRAGDGGYILDGHSPNGTHPCTTLPPISGGGEYVEAYDTITHEYFDAGYEVRWAREGVELGFMNWAGLPDPAPLADFGSLLIGAALRVSTGFSRESFSLPANPTMALVETIGRELDDLDGATISTYLSTYVDPLTGLATSHCDLTARLAATYLIEAAVFDQARKSVSQVMWDAKRAYDNVPLGQAAGADWRTFLTILGVTTRVLGLFTGPAGGAVSGGVGIGITILEEFVLPEQKEVSALPGDSVFGVNMGVSLALETLNEHFRSEEQQALDQATGGTLALDAHPERYYLGRPDVLTDEVDRSSIIGDLQVNREDIRKTAEKHMPALAAEFTGAADVMPQRPAMGAWARNEAVGLGTYGANSEMAALSLALESPLRKTGEDLVLSGQHLMAALAGIEATDEQWATIMTESRQRIDDTYDPPTPTYTDGGRGPGVNVPV